MSEREKIKEVLSGLNYEDKWDILTDIKADMIRDMSEEVNENMKYLERLRIDIENLEDRNEYLIDKIKEVKSNGRN